MSMLTLGRLWLVRICAIVCCSLLRWASRCMSSRARQLVCCNELSSVLFASKRSPSFYLRVLRGASFQEDGQVRTNAQPARKCLRDLAFLFDECRCKVCGKKPGRHTFDLEELPTTGAKLNMLKYIMRKRLSVKLCVLCCPCVWSEFV